MYLAEKLSSYEGFEEPKGQPQGYQTGQEAREAEQGHRRPPPSAVGGTGNE